MNQQNNPPTHLDNAKVLQWAWSGDKPFGVVYSSDGAEDIKIYGLAICQYEGSSTFYRFSCDQHWNVMQDMDYETIEEAIAWLPEQYKMVERIWNVRN